ncbi:flavodoxin family protein [Vreelandella massiliensis]|uniref:flavodoxin family protein n=1 Tax=Vreelandella massiliensis TaxID=1816686 RepID=UPI00096AC4C9|nr:flavodoxin [Halomonas massiliensis]MYL24173.1 flavodoxin family protein [Halomonas alkaliantarctica]
MKTLLLISHAPSPNTQRLRDAALRGACHEDIDNVRCVVKAPQDTTADDILACDAVLLGTTENLGYMAGLTKDLFDRCYYSVIEEKQGLPFGLYIRAGHDGTGTQRAIESIVTGLRWRWVQPPLILRGEWQDDFANQVEELSMYLAVSLENGIV